MVDIPMAERAEDSVFIEESLEETSPADSSTTTPLIGAPKEPGGLDEDEDTSDLNSPGNFFTREYYDVLKSPTFLITFFFAVFSRLSACLDVLTDYLQAHEYYKGYTSKNGTEVGFCDGRDPWKEPSLDPVLHNITTNNGTRTHTDFPFETDWAWLAITVLSLYLPALSCIFRHSADELRLQFLDHHFNVIPWRKPKKILKRRRDKFRDKLESCVLKLFLFPFLPVLIVVRQFRQLVITMELEHRNQTLQESLDEDSTFTKLWKKIKSCPTKLREKIKNCFCCFSNKKKPPDPECHAEHQTEDFSESTKDKQKCCPLLNCTLPCSSKGSKSEEEINELKLQKAVKKLFPRKKKDCRRSVLTNELTQLSDDRVDEALIETTPQAILNMAIIFRFGGSTKLRILSGLFSFFSIGSSTTAIAADKLKTNPVKREFNHLGKLFVTMATFPAILSRCVVLSLVISIHPNTTDVLMLKWAATAFFVTCGALGMVYEYWHTDHKQKMSARLFYHLFLRGYSSIFNLQEYRIKRCEEGKIICEAEDEARNADMVGKDKERCRAQMIHLLCNTLINIAFAIWFFHPILGYSESTCTGWAGWFAVHGSPNSRNPKLWIFVITAGAPISLFFTYLLQCDAVHKATTELGLKPIEALNIHVRSVLKRENLEDIEECLRILEEDISAQDRERVAKVIDPRDRSVLCYVLHCDFVNGKKMELFLRFYKLGFPIRRDVKELLVMKNNSTKPVSGQKRRESVMTQFRNSLTNSGTFSEIYAEMEIWKLTPLSLYPVPTNDDIQSMMCDEDNVALHIGNFIYIWGGKSSAPSSLVVYDIKARTAEVKTTKGDIPPQLWKSSATVGSDELIYLFGGRMEADTKRGDTAINELYCLDVKTLHWSKIQHKNPPKDHDIPSPRSSVAMWCWENDLWIFGGELNHESIEYNFDNSIHRFNLKSKKWKQIEATGAHPSERYGVAICVDGSDKLYLYAGMQQYGTSNQLYMLTKKDQAGEKLRWEHLPTRRKLPAVTHGTICMNGANDLLILGGGWPGGSASTLYSYNLQDVIDKQATESDNKGSKRKRQSKKNDPKEENKARRVSVAEDGTTKISILLTLPDLLHGEQSMDHDVGLRYHHMFLDMEGKQVIVLGGKYGPVREGVGDNNFIVELDFRKNF